MLSPELVARRHDEVSREAVSRGEFPGRGNEPLLLPIDAVSESRNYHPRRCADRGDAEAGEIFGAQAETSVRVRKGDSREIRQPP